jgi:formate--tetrahydrofolate ligase
VATIKALRYHGGAQLADIKSPNAKAVEAGFENLAKHIENMQHFKVQPVVAINKFNEDTDEEIEIVRQKCAELGVKAVVSDGWAQGGDGTRELANAVAETADKDTGSFERIYDWDMSIEEKVEAIAKKLYGADGVDFAGQAQVDLRRIKRLGLEKLPVCIAKTQKSLSDNDQLIGRPSGFRITVREIEIAAGAGFVIPITGKILRMPGLPKVPASEGMDIDANGVITGLS